MITISQGDENRATTRSPLEEHEHRTAKIGQVQRQFEGVLNGITQIVGITVSEDMARDQQYKVWVVVLQSSKNTTQLAIWVSWQGVWQ